MYCGKVRCRDYKTSLGGYTVTNSGTASLILPVSLMTVTRSESDLHFNVRVGRSRAPMLSLLNSNLLAIFVRTWYLGFTSFGGPVVHFQIFHRMLVEAQNPWIDEQNVSYRPFSDVPSPFCCVTTLTILLQFQELFTICQTRSGQYEDGFLHSVYAGRILAAIMFLLIWR
jgi:hypothetical protein